MPSKSRGIKHSRAPRAPKSSSRARPGVPGVALKLRQFVHSAHGARPATIRKSTAGHRAEDTFNGIRTLSLQGFGISEEHSQGRKIGQKRDKLQRKLAQVLAPCSSVRERLKTDDPRLLEMLDTIYAELNDADDAASKRGTERRRTYSNEWKKIMSSDGGVLTDARIKLLETATRDGGMWEGDNGGLGAAAQRRQLPMDALAAVGAAQSADDAAQSKILELTQALEASQKKAAELQAHNDRLQAHNDRLQQELENVRPSGRVPFGGSYIVFSDN